jgi:DNA-directed RNA polymerase subunit RPC12/RpoP
MLDILASAKATLKPKELAQVEAIIEYALSGVAEDYYIRTKTGSWKEAYNYAASYLSPEEGGDLVIKRWKQEYPPILEIHAKAVLHEVSRDHFLKLFKKKEPKAVIQALSNIERWKREDDTEISSWAKAMMTSLVNDFNMGIGPGGSCVCVSCGEEIPKITGVPCTQIPCPKCNGNMLRKEAVSELVVPVDPQPIEDEEEDEVVDVDLDDDESPKPLEADIFPKKS